jgi:hypothetical protein
METSGGRRKCGQEDWKKDRQRKRVQRRRQKGQGGEEPRLRQCETGLEVTFGLNKTQSANSTVPEAVVVKRCQRATNEEKNWEMKCHQGGSQGSDSNSGHQKRKLERLQKVVADRSAQDANGAKEQCQQDGRR